jgi:hypothetical protein
MTPKPYFSFDPDSGLDFHETLEEAKDAAQRTIDEYRDCCDPSWSEDVEHVCYGIVVALASEVVLRAPSTDGPDDNGTSDYVLEEIPR